MLPGRFLAALRRNGPALARWPNDERAAALALLRLSARSRRQFADALDFPGDGPEDAAALARMRAGLRAAVLARDAYAERRRERRVGWAALAACAAVGIVVGGFGETERTDLAADAVTALLAPPTVVAAADAAR